MINIIPMPDEYKYFTLEAAEIIKQADIVILQTSKTPVCQEITQNANLTETLDRIFEEAETFDELYLKGAEFIEKFSKNKKAAFLILGEPSENGFVEKLKEKDKLNYIYTGNLSGKACFYGSAEFGGSGVFTVSDARKLPQLKADTSKMLIIAGIENDWLMANVKLFLQEYYRGNIEVLLFNESSVKKIKIQDLNDLKEYGAGAAVAVGAQPLPNKKRYGFNDLLSIMNILRSPDGCPWDAEQTHKSLKPYLLEESYEVMDAVDKDDMFSLYDELGDVLLQVVFHSEIANQCGEFDIYDVTTAICKKLIRRHPHIFGDTNVDNAEEVLANWEEIKRGEKGFNSITQSLKDIPQNMGALMRAFKIQKKAGAAGFDWDTAEDALEKIFEEIEELRLEIKEKNIGKIEDEGGDLLFSVVNVLRKCKVNPELALKETCEKFIKRFSFIEEHSHKPLKNTTLAEMDALWERAKTDESD